MRLDSLDNFRHQRRRLGRILGWVSVACLAWAFPSQAQTSTELQAILARLDRLEEQNRALSAEVRTLKEELAAARGEQTGAGPTVEERLAVQESRTAEQAQTKVEAAGRFPIRLTGMALFNAYLNSGGGVRTQYPSVESAGETRSGGATFRQSVIGLDFNGPRSLWDARLSGSLRMDLYGGGGQPLYQTVRLRTATIGLDWKTRSLLAGVSKPIISPREPESLAHVAISPLSGAGNLWMWLPQVRLQQELRIGEQGGARVQFGVVQTREAAAAYALDTTGRLPRPPTTNRRAPAFEARLELFGGRDRRLEIAPGFHRSVSHVAGTSVPSQVVSLDWLVRLSPTLEFTGAAFKGQNVTPLGTGGLRQGVVVAGPGQAWAVRSIGGWGQFTYRARPRLWFNLFTGQQDDRNSDLPQGGVGKNLAYGANLFFRLAPNVLASLETSQTRARYIGGSTLLSNRYDLALAYLF